MDRFNARIDNTLRKTFKHYDLENKNPKSNPNYVPLKTLKYSEWSQYTPENCQKIFKEIMQQTKNKVKEIEDQEMFSEEFECISNEIYESQKDVH